MTELVGSDATVRTVRRLAGGTHAATHLFETEPPDRALVLRRFPVGDPSAAYEARVLTALDGLGGWAPRMVDVDSDGRRFGEPAIVISRVDGGPDITPDSPIEAARQLGRTLARVHAVPLDRLNGLRDGVGAPLAPAARASDQDRGPAAAIMTEHRGRLAEQPVVLTHYDFWSGNVLWVDGVLTGVIDWSGGSLAPRGFDVSWCRLDLVLLYGPELADTFVSAYESAAGETVPELVLWDLFALTNSHHSVETWSANYCDLGRTGLTANELRARHTKWTEHCLAWYRDTIRHS